MSIKVNATVSEPVRSHTIPSGHVSGLSRMPTTSALNRETLWDTLSQQESLVLENPTTPHIEQYLAIVRSLLQAALKRHSARSAPYWSPKGQFRQMVHIAEVNQALEQLLNDIRAGHPATLLARRLDAIRGLLLDLWL